MVKVGFVYPDCVVDYTIKNVKKFEKLSNILMEFHLNKYKDDYIYHPKIIDEMNKITHNGMDVNSLHFELPFENNTENEISFNCSLLKNLKYLHIDALDY